MSSPEQASAAAIDRALVLLDQPGSAERTYKTDRDYATTTDFLIEDELRTLLARLTPDIGFLGEERGHSGPTETYWCLDPIDGTTNFTRGLPNFGIALALITNAQPVHGEIALPAHRERYTTRDSTADLAVLAQMVGTVNRFDDDEIPLVPEEVPLARASFAGWADELVSPNAIPQSDAGGRRPRSWPVMGIWTTATPPPERRVDASADGAGCRSRITP